MNLSHLGVITFGDVRLPLGISWWAAWVTVEWVIRVGVTISVIRRRLPTAPALTWICITAFLPELGLILYALFGDDRLPRRRIQRYRRVMEGMLPEQRRAALAIYATRPRTDAAQAAVVLQAERISGMSILGGNEVEPLADTHGFIDRLVADIDAATHHVHLLFYIFEPDETGKKVADALGRAAARGVTCRVLADYAGSRSLFMDGELLDGLASRGVAVRPALPVATFRRRLARIDLRNHRKLAVIDGRVAYTGSQNIVNARFGDRRAGRYVDLSVRLRGPVVSQLQNVFLDDWAFDTGEELDQPELLPPQEFVGETAAQAVPTGPTGDNESFIRVLIAAINAAQRKIVITSPYFVPDEATSLALLMAADRGVDITLVLPAVADHRLVAAAGRAYYDSFLDAGVHIRQHHEGMLHAKTVTVDDAFALLGSANMDIRSFYLNFELSVLLYGAPITRQLRFAQTQYIEQSTPISPEAWSRRPRLRRFLDNAAALLSPVL